jgi:hypothetical protein
VLLRDHSFFFGILYNGTVDTGVVRTANMLGSEVSGTDCAECYVNVVLWDVTLLTFVGRAEQRSGNKHCLTQGVTKK